MFTNLTQDHLDYHKTFENYFARKEKPVQPGEAHGGEPGRQLRPPPAGRGAGAGAHHLFRSATTRRTYTARNIRLSASGVTASRWWARGFIQRIDFPMPGELLGAQRAGRAAAAAIALGIARAGRRGRAFGLPRGARPVRGAVSAARFTILCDYAHTGDAIEKVLAGVAPFVEGRLVVLYRLRGRARCKKTPADERSRGEIC